MYSSYTAAQLARTYELADLHKVNLLGSVTWAFEFEDQPYFDGFRDLATNGIDKPVLNVFRMLGHDGRRSRGRREHAARCRSRRFATPASAISPTSTRSRAAAIARSPSSSGTITTTTCRARRPTVDADDRGLAAGRAEWRSSTTASTATTATPTRRGRQMGSPQPPTPAQYAALEKAGQLQVARRRRRVPTTNGRVTLTLTLPRQGVSLVKLTW